MIALDTNALFRLLVDDPGAPAQCRAVRAVAAEAGGAWVATVVMVELVWVLQRAAGLTRAQVAPLIQHLLDNRAFTLQDAAAVRVGLAAWRAGNADFADYLILAGARAVGHPLMTFDRKLGRAEGAQLIVTRSSAATGGKTDAEAE